MRVIRPSSELTPRTSPQDAGELEALANLAPTDPRGHAPRSRRAALRDGVPSLNHVANVSQTDSGKAFGPDGVNSRTGSVSPAELRRCGPLAARDSDLHDLIIPRAYASDVCQRLQRHIKLDLCLDGLNATRILDASGKCREPSPRHWVNSCGTRPVVLTTSSYELLSPGSTALERRLEPFEEEFTRAIGSIPAEARRVYRCVSITRQK